MEKSQNGETFTKIINYSRKYMIYFSLLYNIIWGAIFGILIYSNNSSNSSCEDIINWGIACFSFCIICPLKTYFLKLFEKICEINQSFIFIVGMISSCAISILFVVGLSIVNKANTSDICKSFSNFEFGFMITECFYILYFCCIFSCLLYNKFKENYAEGNGMISIKTLD